MASYLKNGDVVRIMSISNSSYVYVDSVNQPSNPVLLKAEQGGGTSFVIIKVKLVQNGTYCNGKNTCGTFTPCDVGEVINYGDTIYLWSYGNYYGNAGFPYESHRTNDPLSWGNAGSTPSGKPGYIVPVNGAPNLTGNGDAITPYGGFGFCGWNQQKDGNQTASRGLFSIVDLFSRGLVNGQRQGGCNFANSATTLPVSYTDSFLLQVIFENCCQDSLNLYSDPDFCFLYNQSKNINSSDYNYNSIVSCATSGGGIPTKDTPIYLFQFLKGKTNSTSTSKAMTYTTPSGSNVTVSQSNSWTVAFWIVLVLLILAILVIIYLVMQRNRKATL